MSRCQHAQKITHFCITQTCAWKQSSGCQNCMKKYHNHIGKTKYIKQQQINQMLQKLTVSSDSKTKCRHYQEALYNYFNNLKNQFNNTIDSISKQMLHRVGSPYLYHKGYINIYRKLKAKDYRKIAIKQFSPFLNFLKNIDHDQLQKQQKRLYHIQAEYSFKVIKELHQTLNKLNQATKQYDVKFDSGNDFYAKIQELNKLRQALFNKQKAKLDITVKVNNLTPQINKNDLMSSKTNETANTKNVRSRRLSIDTTFQPIKIPHKISKHEQNEKQISNRKQQLINILNQKKNGLSAIKIKDQSLTQKKIQTPAKQLNNKSQNRLIKPQEIQLTNNINYSPQNKSDQNEEKIQNHYSDEKKQNKNQANLFDFLLTKGINFPQLIVHTVLPEAKSNKKLYDEAQVVKKKTIPIPMKPLPEQQEPSSPLLKKRKTTTQQQFSMGVKKISNSQDIQNQQSYQNIPSNLNVLKKFEEVNEQTNQQSQHHIEDHEANSVALLMQSLHLNIDDAIPVLEAALRQCKNNLSAAEYLTFLYIQNNQPKQCLNLCNQLLEKLEHSHEYEDMSGNLLNNKAAALNILGRYSQSIVILQKILVTNPKDIYYKNLADAYFSIAIYQKALFNYEKAVKLNEHFDEAYYNMAVCLFMQENYNNSKIAIDNALKLCPKNQNYLELLVNIKKRITAAQ